MSEALIDNDIILKICHFGIDRELDSLFDSISLTPVILAVSRFVIVNRLRRTLSDPGLQEPVSGFQRTITKWTAIEPSHSEIELAAALESRAQHDNLELDIGESQLLAILISRDYSAIFTGDKRAIRAIEVLTDDVSDFLVCLEQVILSLILICDRDSLRDRICASPTADKTLSICFSCRASSGNHGTTLDCLRSHIAEIRRSAPRTLIYSDDLSRFVT